MSWNLISSTFHSLSSRSVETRRFQLTLLRLWGWSLVWLSPELWPVYSLLFPCLIILGTCGVRGRSYTFSYSFFRCRFLMPTAWKACGFLIIIPIGHSLRVNTHQSDIDSLFLSVHGVLRWSSFWLQIFKKCVCKWQYDWDATFSLPHAPTWVREGRRAPRTMGKRDRLKMGGEKEHAVFYLSLCTFAGASQFMLCPSLPAHESHPEPITSETS